MLKQVFLFEQGSKALKDLLGSKGANLAEMTRLGLPVPPGFIITTSACIDYLSSNAVLPDPLKIQVETALHKLEITTGRLYGYAKHPLLVSVRSGAPVSMPGMMETILNLGLNDETVLGLVAQTGDRRFAFDSYRRLISMFGEVVFNIPKDRFEGVLEERKRQSGVLLDTALHADEWEAIVEAYKQVFQTHAGRPFPQSPKEQLWLAIEAVFNSWNIPRAVTYRKHHQIPHDLGTAVNVQAMVFGNMGPNSATGVAFTRNPSQGERGLYGEYLINAQGEDVVAGTRTPQKIAVMKEEMPAIYHQLQNIASRLETHYQEMQDIEFTIECGQLYILQTRTGKRTAHAAVRIAVDMVHEGILTAEEALLKIDANQLAQLLLPMFDPEVTAQERHRLLAVGLNASPGAAVGQVVFDADEAAQLGNAGEAVILVRPETVPDDIHGMIAAQGVLTTRGGSTSHAAVVARGMGKPCITGCEAAVVDLQAELLMVNGVMVRKGESISINGTTGEVFLGELPLSEAKPQAEFETLLSWADHWRTLGVRANADTPEDAQKARELGAKGIGLCRTEHMFMAPERLAIMQSMILAEDDAERRMCLEKLLPMQQEDFKGIFQAMAGCPVTVRLLDPPLHEFLPDPIALTEQVTRLRCAKSPPKNLPEQEALLAKVMQLRESNPMLGFRGCRLGLLYPEIYEMQVMAIFEAATDLAIKGVSVNPEVMIPLVGTAEELKRLRQPLEAVAEMVMERKGVTLLYHFGTMIEVPRAALMADDIARHADFFSFGTNDLTQLTYGYSRDDAEGRFLSAYLDLGILPANPFQTLDTDGVGQLMRTACAQAKRVQAEIKLGLCGEHGGDAASVAFCHQAGLHYVSCSPFRVPVARVAAAQAVIAQEREQQPLRASKPLVSV